MDDILTVAILFACIGASAAWVNTNTILGELAVIKKELGIKEENEEIEMLCNEEIEKELEEQYEELNQDK